MNENGTVWEKEDTEECNGREMQKTEDIAQFAKDMLGKSRFGLWRQLYLDDQVFSVECQDDKFIGWTGQDMEGNGHRSIKVLSQILSGWIENDNPKLDSRCLGQDPNPATSRTQIQSVSATVTYSVKWMCIYKVRYKAVTDLDTHIANKMPSTLTTLREQDFQTASQFGVYAIRRDPTALYF